jgi:hypothetical protein
LAGVERWELRREHSSGACRWRSWRAGRVVAQRDPADAARQRAALSPPGGRHIFDDTTVATAILDRLLHHATVLSITGDSYRMRAHQDALDALRPAITVGEFS